MRVEMLNSILENLNSVSPSVEASAIISIDGLVMASRFPNSVDDDRLAAMSAAMLSLAEKAADELERGNVQQIFVRGEKGYIILTHAGEDAVLTVMTRPDAKLGLVLLDIKRSVKDVCDLL
ncbi:MAG: roadblock/LC7 domain-containing protein [bacterium]